MKKYSYLARLEELLDALPAEERQDALNYYEEFFDASGAEDSAAAGLEPPEEAARKILEGEGIAPPAPRAEAAPEAAPAAPPQPPETPPQTAGPAASSRTVWPTPPAAPEPPPLEDPQYGPAAGKARWQPPRPFSHRGWLLFVGVLAVAFLVQLAVLVLNFAHFGGSAEMVAASEAVAPADEPQEAITEYVTGDAAGPARPIDVTPEPTAMSATGTGYAQNMVCSMERGDSLEISLRSGKMFLEVNEDINDRSASIGVRNADNSFAVQQTEDGDWLIGSTDHSGKLILTVKIPRGMLSAVRVSVGQGDIAVKNNLAVDTLMLETGNGRITTQKISAVDAELKTDNGHISIGAAVPQNKLEVVAGGGAAELLLAGAKSDYSLYVISKTGVLHDGGEQAEGRSLKTGQTDRPTVTVQADGDITLEYSSG